MTLPVGFALACGVCASSALATPAVEAESEDCAQAAAKLPKLVETRLVGEEGELQASVRLVSVPSGTRAVIVVQGAGTPARTRSILAPSCEEAADAAASVVALALSAPLPPSLPQPESPGDSEQSSPRSGAREQSSPRSGARPDFWESWSPVDEEEQLTLAPTKEIDKDQIRTDSRRARAISKRFRILPELGWEENHGLPGILYGASLARRWTWAELRLFGWFSPTLTEEPVEDLAALGADPTAFGVGPEACLAAEEEHVGLACLALDVERWNGRTMDGRGGYEWEHRTALAGLLNFELAYRRAWIQPTLRIGLRLPLIQPGQETRNAAFRLSVGTGVPF